MLKNSIALQSIIIINIYFCIVNVESYRFDSPSFKGDSPSITPIVRRLGDSPSFPIKFFILKYASIYQYRRTYYGIPFYKPLKSSENTEKQAFYGKKDKDDYSIKVTVLYWCG